MKANSDQIPFSLQSCKTLFWFCIALWGACALGFAICFMALCWGLACDWVLHNPFPWGWLFELYAFAGWLPLAIGAPVLLVLSIFARHAAGLLAGGVDYIQAQRAGTHVGLE